MLEPPSIGLRIVTGEELDRAVRDMLKPGETLRDRAGVGHVLPRYFYEVPSREAAMETALAPNFGLWELVTVDVRETPALRGFPRYVPCGITLLASHLQLLRNEVGKVVRIAANGGYRSPGHRESRYASAHCWGTAANIYRIGDEWLDTRVTIEKFRETTRAVLPGVWTRPYGNRAGFAFDHLHLDLGYLVVEPHEQSTASADT